MGSTVTLGQKRDVFSWLYQICYYLIAGILCFSGLTKVIDPGPLLETLAAIAFLPEAASVLLATLLPIAEMGLAVLMVLKIQQRPVLIGAFLLFSGFLLFSIYGVAAGLDADCGCFGSAVSSKFGPGMIIRNAGFAGMAGWVLFNTKETEGKESASKGVRG